MSLGRMPQTEVVWRAVPAAPFTASPPAWRLRAWQWFLCAVQLLLGRVGVVTYVPVRVSHVPRILHAVHTDPRYCLSYRFLSSLRSPPHAP